MLRLLRPPNRAALVPLAGLAMLAPALVACGDEAPANPDTYDRLDAVTITGEVGKPPEVEWKGQMEAGKIESEPVVTGDGEELGDKDSVLVQLWIGNGYSETLEFSTYEEAKAELFTVGDQLPPFLESVKGATVGSRIAVTSSAEEAFGEGGNPALGIGNEDTVLVIVDLVSGIADDPSGTRSPAPAWMPPITFEKGTPSGFIFEGVPKPTDKLRKAVLLAGDGAVVKKGDTVAVRYVGEVFGGTKPFDENFSAPAPTAFAIGLGQVIKGWDKALEGATVGTRMVIEVPPDLGYGKDGNPDAKIKGTDTLVFLIDVLGVA